MKIVKKILLGIVVLIALVLIIAAFVKKDYAVEREITINKPTQEVFNYIKYLKNQDNFSVWAMEDPNMKKEFTGTDGTVGFKSAWDSEKDDVGKGEQTIEKISEGTRIDFGLHFIKPFEGKASAYMTTEPSASVQTKVKWGLNSSMNYPMNIMLLFMNMDEMLGKDLAEGLSNLKNVMEK